MARVTGLNKAWRQSIVSFVDSTNHISTERRAAAAILVSSKCESLGALQRLFGDLQEPFMTHGGRAKGRCATLKGWCHFKVLARSLPFSDKR